MDSSVKEMLCITLDYLQTLHRENVRPAEALARIRGLRQCVDIAIDLLWEEEAYGKSVHYDVLLRRDGEGTISLSFCPDRALPWPLRSIHRWDDKDLVRVNNTILKVDQAIACLDFIWDEARIIDRLVNVCLIQEALADDPIELSDEELQLAMDGFRRAHRLYSATDTYRWLEQRGMTHAQLEGLVADEATVAKLRDRVTANQVEAYFAAHRANFDTASIARLYCSDQEHSQRTYTQICGGELDFYAAAERHFLASTEHAEPPTSMVFVTVQRGQASTAADEAIFAATPGDVLSPLRVEDGYAIVRVLSFAPACLNQQTHNAIKKLLFDTWLADRRRAATIEWNWGTSSRTAQAG